MTGKQALDGDVLVKSVPMEAARADPNRPALGG
jgi:hypothetical protein